MKRLLIKTTAAALATFMACSPASAIPVDLELILLTDNSGSIDATDFNLMRNGYVAAFQSAALQTAISQGALGSIAVTLVEFSSVNEQQQTVGWTLIDSAAAANAFAAAMAAAPRPFSGGTGLAAGIGFAAPLFNNGFEGSRRVIDVAGDGAEGEACNFADANCVPLQNARDAALAAGVNTINALWIDDRDFFGNDPADAINALVYGTTNVIGGANPFQNIVDDFADFGPAILSKLQREITNVPEPDTLALLGLGLLGLGAAARRRTANA